jgi:hypothetical protein
MPLPHPLQLVARGSENSNQPSLNVPLAQLTMLLLLLLMVRW